MGKSAVNCFWFRRDLRLHDNIGLYNALQGDLPVMPVFIFDTNILDELEDQMDARVEFIHDELSAIKESLQTVDSDLWVYEGQPTEVWKTIFEEFRVHTIYTNQDYEPYSVERDNNVEELAIENGVEFKSYKDHLIFEAGEIMKNDGDPYVVYTPFKKTWFERLEEGLSEGNKSLVQSSYLASVGPENYLDRFFKGKANRIPTLEDLGFLPTAIEIPGKSLNAELLDNYEKTRDYPAKQGTSRLGIHYRFGTISIREMCRKALEHSQTYVEELIWREFYSQILAHFPRVVDESFYRKYRFINWRNDEEEFEKWCRGVTGYPIVDAGMRQLNTTGYMHNRVCMITASFLTKHLLIDWRWGESYFAMKLLDYELASNNGGWQWAAGTGTDAAPYFRIFNPWLQTEKFDPDKKYIKRWVPEYDTDKYPEPMVEHKTARERCLKVYKAALVEAD